MLFVGKRTQSKDIHKEIFPAYVGKCLSHKAVPFWWDIFADDEEVETEVRKWLRQQPEDFCAAGFGALVKRVDKCISVGEGYVNKYIFSRGSNITFLRFISICARLSHCLSYYG
jgi:hypothetical protein